MNFSQIHTKKRGANHFEKSNKQFSISQNSKNEKRETLKLTFPTKLALTITIMAKFFIAVKNCYIASILFINPGYYSTAYCHIFFVFALIVYAIGRNTIYIFYILRTNDIFKDTTYEQSKRVKHGIFVYIAIINLYALIVIIFASCNADTTVEILQIRGYGAYCMVRISYFGAIHYILFIFHNGLLEIYTMYMMVSRCFRLIFDANAEMMKHKVKGNSIDDCGFHRLTSKDNTIVLSSTRIIILFIVTMVSSIVALFCFNFFTEIPNIGNIVYQFDDLIKVYCLLLTFSFSNRYYRKYFCGNYCTKCCFPYIKMFALTCGSDKRSECKTCECMLYCCYCCRYCCNKSKRNVQANILKMAKSEIELVVDKNN